MESTYDLIAAAGNFNGWSSTPMTLVADYTWQIEITGFYLPGAVFKFNVGNWTLNWGDDYPINGIGDRDGANIEIPIEIMETSSILITFNDVTLAYTIASNNHTIISNLTINSFLEIEVDNIWVGKEICELSNIQNEESFSSQLSTNVSKDLKIITETTRKKSEV